MSTDIKISAIRRSDFGKGAARRYRRDGTVPAVMYGSGSEVRHILLPEHALSLALRIPRVVLDVDLEGARLLVAPRDVQRDVTRDDLFHVDLILLSDADVKERHAFSDALAKAQATAEEAGLDPVLAVAVIEEAVANDEDLDDVAARIVEIIEAQAQALREAAEAAAAREDAAEEAAAAEAAGEELAAEPGGEAADEE